MTTAINTELLAEIDSATPTPVRAVVTAQEAARILGVSDVTLRRWRAKQFGPKPLKAGAHYRYTRKSLAEFLSR